MARTITIVNKFSIDNPGPHVLEGKDGLTKENFFKIVKPALYLDVQPRKFLLGGRHHVVRHVMTPVEANGARDVHREFQLDAGNPMLEKKADGNRQGEHNKWSQEARLAEHIFETVMDLTNDICWYRHPKFAEALGKAVHKLLELVDIKQTIFGDNRPDDNEITALTRENLGQTQALLDCLLAPEMDLDQSIGRLCNSTERVDAFSSRDTMTKLVRKLRAILSGDDTNKLGGEKWEEFETFEITGLGGKRPDKGLISHYRFFRQTSDKLHGMVRFPLVSTAFCYYFFTRFCNEGDSAANTRQNGARKCYETCCNAPGRAVGVSEDVEKQEKDYFKEGVKEALSAVEQEFQNEDEKKVFSTVEKRSEENSKYWFNKMRANKVIGRSDLLTANADRFSRMATAAGSVIQSMEQQQREYADRYAHKIAMAHRRVTAQWDAEQYNGETAFNAFLKLLPTEETGPKSWFESDEVQTRFKECTRDNFGKVVCKIMGKNSQKPLIDCAVNNKKELASHGKTMSRGYAIRSGSTIGQSTEKEGRPAPIIIPDLAYKVLPAADTPVAEMRDTKVLTLSLEGNAPLKMGPQFDIKSPSNDGQHVTPTARVLIIDGGGEGEVKKHLHIEADEPSAVTKDAALIVPRLKKLRLSNICEGGVGAVRGTRDGSLLKLSDTLTFNPGDRVDIMTPSGAPVATATVVCDGGEKLLEIQKTGEEGLPDDAEVEVVEKDYIPLADICEGGSDSLEKSLEQYHKEADEKEVVNLSDQEKSDLLREVIEADRSIVAKAIEDLALAEELRALTLVEYLLAAPAAQIDLDQTDFSQQLGLMQDVASNLAKKWSGQNATQEERESWLKKVNVSCYVNIPSDEQGVNAINRAAGHWKASLEKLLQVEAFKAEINRVTDFIERAEGSGIRVVVINQSWSEYCNSNGNTGGSLFTGLHQLACSRKTEP